MLRDDLRRNQNG